MILELVLGRNGRGVAGCSGGSKDVGGGGEGRWYWMREGWKVEELVGIRLVIEDAKGWREDEGSRARAKSRQKRQSKNP